MILLFVYYIYSYSNTAKSYILIGDGIVEIYNGLFLFRMRDKQNGDGFKLVNFV